MSAFGELAKSITLAGTLLLITACNETISKIYLAPEDSCDIAAAGGSARVVSSPFAIQLKSSDGNTVLSTMGRSKFYGNTLYAPLGFIRGNDPELRYPVLQGLAPQPDPNTSNPKAPEYFKVTSIKQLNCSDLAIDAVMSTDDPAGGVLQLRITADQTGSLAITVTAPNTTQATALFASFGAATDEAFHGFGGRRESTNLRGLAFQNWVQDYRFPDLSSGYYYTQPQFISSKNYGLLLESDALASWRLASDLADAWRVVIAANQLKLVVAPGTAEQAVDRLTRRSGRHRVAPPWSLGPTLSRTIQILPGTETSASYRAKVEQDLEQIENRDLGIEAYAFEGWATLESEFVAAVIERLKRNNIRAILYIRSFVADDSDTTLTEPPERFDQAIENAYVATTSKGEPYFYPNSFNAREAAVIDFTNLAARAWWKTLIWEMLELGADGFMSDFGEQVIADMVFADGSTGATMHNRYPRLQHQTTREAIDEYQAEHPEREIYFFVRAGYGGNPGSTAYENATFPGDEAVDWSKENGLASIVPDMLNRAIGGAFGFSTDIGGYADWTGNGGTSKELFVRWMQAAIFTTHFRVHGSALTGVRMPWSFEPDDPEPKVEELWREAAQLHVRARPLMLDLWQRAVDTGVPITRPMWLHDPTARYTDHNDDQWMLGPDLLVAPVLEEGAVQRDVWLPEGCWQWQDDGERFDGQTLITVSAPLDVLPWFTRCGKKLFAVGVAAETNHN